MADERARVLGAGEERGVGAQDRDARRWRAARRPAGSGRRRSASAAILSADGSADAGIRAPRWPALAAAGVALRALYLFTVARHVTGIGDWHFYHWQANLIADGHGFVEPYKFLLRAPRLAVGRPPAAVSAGAVRPCRSWAATSELSHRALGPDPRRGARSCSSGCSAGARAASGVGPGGRRAVRRLPADDRRRRRADERDALRPADRASRCWPRGGCSTARAPWAALVRGRRDRRSPR